MPTPLDPLDDANDDILHVPLERLSRDLRAKSATLSRDEARYLVDAYYQMQKNRIRAANQVRQLSKANEPHDLLTWLTAQTTVLELSIKGALGVYAKAHPVGQWAQCAPAGSQVMVEGSGRWGIPKYQPIEALADGDTIVSFSRKKAALTYPVPVQTSARPYQGDLVVVQTADAVTRTTPNHKWLVRVEAPQDACVVYLMRRGLSIRVGWCRVMSRPSDRKNGRFHLRRRSRSEKADQVWALKYCQDARSASIYESFVATQYGLPLLPFEPVRGSLLYTRESLDEFFEMLNGTEQLSRAVKCLADHGLNVETPLLSDLGFGTKETVASQIVYAANLTPNIMQVPVPLKSGGFEWRPITQISHEPYDGHVYSLNVERHHKYVQDGLITCNSICGIGPVISAGLLAHIDMAPWKCVKPKDRCTAHAPCSDECRTLKIETVGQVWRFAGLDPTVKWEKRTKRPFNAQLKRLCWLIGESFVKMQSREGDVYGKLYAERKALEETRNAEGAFADQAAKSLTEKSWQRETATKEHYLAGRLPPARIHLRAQRWAVKLFLAHYHHVAYETHWGTPPPKPYVISILGHAHEIKVPNWPLPQKKKPR